MEKTSKQVGNMLVMDKIRIMKLLEMCQFTILGVILGVYSGRFISRFLTFNYKESNYINETYPKNSNNKNPKLIFHVIIDLCIITVTLYYLKKTSEIIPFLFSFIDKKYISNLKSEGGTGFTIGIGFVYLRILKNFQSRLNLLLTNV